MGRCEMPKVDVRLISVSRAILLLQRISILVPFDWEMRIMDVGGTRILR